MLLQALRVSHFWCLAPGRIGQEQPSAGTVPDGEFDGGGTPGKP